MPLLATPLLRPWDYVGIGVGAAVLAVALAVVARRVRAPSRPGRDGEPRVSRRTIIEQGAVGASLAALAGLVAASIDYVVSAVDSRRGRSFTLQSPEDVRRQVRSTGRPYYDPVGGFYVMPYPAGDLPGARSRYAAAVLDGMEQGFVALDQTCTHLGCRVLWCPSSQWFECPCHGSRFNAVGEQRRGPAPRGLDRFPVTVVDGRVTVDTGARYPGPPPGTDTTRQEPAGPHCF